MCYLCDATDYLDEHPNITDEEYESLILSFPLYSTPLEELKHCDQSWKFFNRK